MHVHGISTSIAIFPFPSSTRAKPTNLNRSLELKLIDRHCLLISLAFSTTPFFLAKFETMGIINTNPVSKTTVDNGLSEVGKKQTVRSALALKEMRVCKGSCWIWPSITQRPFQAAEIIASINGINHSYFFSFTLSARKLYVYKSRVCNKETQEAVAMATPIPIDTFNLGFIGAGKMAESIAKGVVKSGVLPASRIRTAVHNDASRKEVFSSIGVKVFDTNKEVVEDSNVIIFSVKPQVVKDVVLQLTPVLSKKQLLVSVAAGTNLSELQEWAGHDRFIRVMPNTPAAVGEAASVMSLGTTATKEDGELVANLFGAIGKIWTVNEKLFDAVTGLSGSGPAYIFLAIDAMADGGVAAGLPRDLARGLACQTVLGAASMTIKTGKHPGQLKDDVASPGGTTIAGIHELEKGGFRGILMNAIVAAAKRGRELSQS
ncbi:hypothetical protein NE237_009100 [Protea cynaroides]|uniref:Pyrroline-5-carboxylate reductase n=1 Tax=Protea cynaroides TaxID=273540 RepID=A0A9Q0KX33_9MAGN|nr:hypothetical protein NE237_009100 [Protea cynaroides]